MTPFPHLFGPARVGSKTLRHRLNFGAHTANMGAEALVLATVNAPERSPCDALAESGREVHPIGDCVAARQAPAAIHEGRKLALEL